MPATAKLTIYPRTISLTCLAASIECTIVLDHEPQRAQSYAEIRCRRDCGCAISRSLARQINEVRNLTRSSTESVSRLPTPDASRFVLQFAARLARAAREKPILDAPCGSGRNATPLLQLGCSVICADRDVQSLRARIASQPGDDWSRVDCRQIDFLTDKWPFQKESVGGVVNVHHFSASLIPLLVHTLAPGGYLLTTL